MAFHDLTMQSLDGDSVDFSQFAGAYNLVVNVASRWGATPQYAGLRALHHDVDGLNVLGFPCNQFGAQEPCTAAEIREFVDTNYNIDFPMFDKIDVNGDNEAEIYGLLKQGQPGDIAWNFEKFLVDHDGNAIARWDTATTPEDIAAALPDLMK